MLLYIYSLLTKINQVSLSGLVSTKDDLKLFLIGKSVKKLKNKTYAHHYTQLKIFYMQKFKFPYIVCFGMGKSNGMYCKYVGFLYEWLKSYEKLE